MRLLLDTQVALWWLVGAKRLSPASRRRIASSACVVSVASVWHDEHAIASGALAIEHADPFDRLLIATALVEGLRLMTADATLIEFATANPSLPISAA